MSLAQSVSLVRERPGTQPPVSCVCCSLASNALCVDGGLSDEDAGVFTWYGRLRRRGSLDRDNMLGGIGAGTNDGIIALCDGLAGSAVKELECAASQRSRPV